MNTTPLLNAVLSYGDKASERFSAVTKKVEALCERVDVRPVFLIENIVNLMGSVYARMNAKKSLADSLSPKQLDTLTKLITGALVIQKHPEVIDAHNLNPNSIRAALTGAGEDEGANRILTQIADSAASEQEHLTATLNQYNQAIASGDQPTADKITREFAQMWQYWQRQLASQPAPAAPAAPQSTPPQQ